MSRAGGLQSSMLDLVFPLAGRSLPREHAGILRQILLAELPWLAGEPLAGIHPVKLVHGGSGSEALLSQRSRLLLRLPRARADAAGALAGCSLAVGDQVLRLGVPHVRELLPHGTLYAHAVASAGDDETEFVRQVTAELAALELRAPWICGKRQSRPMGDGRRATAFSFMVHNLTPEESLRLQERGLGGDRLLGCGIFVPHKTTAAVGE